MRQINIILAVLFCSLSVVAQNSFSAKKISSRKLSTSIKYKGKLKEAWQWKDSLGMNFLLFSVTDVSWGPDEDEQTIQLFAYHYCKKDSQFQLLWKLNDIVKECPVDIVAEFIKGSTAITDLDSNGIAETTLIYKLACRGDVSPANMKLIMHEDSVKYALRGTMWSPYGNGDTIRSEMQVTEKDVNLEKLPGYKGTDEEYYKLFGRYQTEKDFTNAPKEFLAFARSQWLRYVKESFE
jgi:hypothetical protein